IGKIEKVLVDSGVVAGGPNLAMDDELPMRTLSNGVNVSLFRREEAEFRDEALTKAVQKALAKAKSNAKGAGVQIKDTVSIIENDVAPDSGTRLARPSTTVAPAAGELEVTVRVTVKCSY